jgi:CRP-like cAMP-binding protein
MTAVTLLCDSFYRKAQALCCTWSVSKSELLQRLERKGVLPKTFAFKKGEKIFREGEPGITLFFLLAGKIALITHTPDGRALGLAVLRPGDVFGELALATGERYVTAQALTEVTVALVPADATKSLARDDPELLDEIFSVIGRRLQMAVKAVTDLLSVPLRARLARQLLNLATDNPDSHALEVDLTQEVLSTLVGASREAVNRELRRFARRGWVVLRRGRIVVRLPRELAAYAEYEWPERTIGPWGDPF